MRILPGFSGGRGIAVGLIAVLLPGLASGQALLPQLPVTNNDGTIRTITKSGNTVYVGGAFDYIGPLTGSAALLDLSTGAPTPGFPGIGDGVVSAFASDGSGGW